ncbi:Gfo/Idh/MocA family protein [Roseobacter weihaiensis]|uniref:Gfo/Idh/MocA family protein n=1 Tax=Roseobacter weihaiensis TaxID=2763262 RepID=UPI001D0B5A3C|nr:Gfo/Idh/MocA family oxidoreductase [Roseobacter sp. H9]
MQDKIKIAVVGLGKMGLSHFSMVRAHPNAETIACDATGFLVDVLSKNIPGLTVHRKYDRLLETEDLDAVVIATPSRMHDTMVRAALERDIHVFCEKPFCLDWRTAEALADLAEARGLVNQVGYHYRYVGAFQHMKKLLEAGAIGRVTHVQAEAYGPVVLRENKKSWRNQKSEGGGCLYDYAAHPLNLLNWFFGAPTEVSGSVLSSIFSRDTDDAVLSTLQFGAVPAQLSVNWSDESHRKMSTKITMIGTNGRLYADRQECQLFLREVPETLSGYEKGWTVKYTTELTEDPWFYLRGEEYSNQLDGFIQAVRAKRGAAEENDFRSAALTDKSIAMILEDNARSPQAAAAPAPSPAQAGRKRSWFGRA